MSRKPSRTQRMVELSDREVVLSIGDTRSRGAVSIEILCFLDNEAKLVGMDSAGRCERYDCHDIAKHWQYVPPADRVNEGPVA